MARSCGIRIGPRRFELVVLDGSVKKHKISAYHVGEFSPEHAAAFAEGDVSGVAATLKDAAKAHRIPSDNVSIVVASDHAAFRRVTLPFSDRQKIDQVLKYEIESELPQFDIEDVVVDYHVMSENESGAELLVTAVPKDDVQRTLSACEKAGFEALEAELEGTAVVNAAFAADMCHIDDAQLLVHVGEHSTCVAVVAGAELREFRVIHIGAMTHLMADLDGEMDAADDVAGEGGEEDGDHPAGGTSIDPIESSRRIDQAIKRIRRELGRTISAARTPQTIEAIYACGMELPGLIGGEVLGVPVYVLDCFDEDSGQPADGFGQLVGAYGGAYRQLGGGLLKPSLRRDELRFTGTWERLEFPVAFAALMLATFLGMLNIINMRKLDAMNYGGVLPKLQLSNLFMVGSPENRKSKPIMDPVPKDLADRAANYRGLDGQRLAPGVTMPIDELQVIDEILAKKVLGLQKDVGEVQEIPLPPSAMSATTLVLEVLMGNPEWRPSLRSIESSLQGEKGTTPEHIRVRLGATFFADDTVAASEHLNAFKRAVDAKSWSMGVSTVSTDAVTGDIGVSFDKLDILVNPVPFLEARSN